MFKFIIIIFIITCVYTLSINAQEQNFSSSDSVLTYISSEKALEKAIAYTGFQNSRSFTGETSIKIDIIQVDGLNAPPQIIKQIVGRSAWVITFNNILLNYEIHSENGDKIFPIDEIPRDFDIYIDTKDGTLLGLKSKISDNDKSYIDIWNDFSMPFYCDEKAIDLSIATNSANSTLFDLLNRKTASNPLTAEEIEAYFITFHWIADRERLNCYPEDSSDIWYIMYKYIDERKESTYVKDGVEMQPRNIDYIVEYDTRTSKPLMCKQALKPPR